MHACIMSACTMRTCTLRARTLRACTVRACTLRACKVRACTSDFKQKIRRQSDTQSINQSEWPCHFLSCLSQLKIKPKKCHKKWKKSKKAGGGIQRWKSESPKFKMWTTVRWGGCLDFHIFPTFKWLKYGLDLDGDGWYIGEILGCVKFTKSFRNFTASDFSAVV